jgi:tRNA pseudouridine55 synthase
VVAHSLTLVAIDAGRCTVDVHCGKGYYVRALARDLGRALGVYGHVSALRRTAVGPFPIERAVSLGDAVERIQLHELDALLHAPDAVLTGWPAIILGVPDVSDIRVGRAVSPAPRFAGSADSSRVRAYGPDGSLVALAEATESGAWHPYRVFASETKAQ